MIKCVCGLPYPKHGEKCINKDNMFLVMHFKENWKVRYFTARYEWYKRTSPDIVRKGFYFNRDLPKVKTSNGLQKFIINFLFWTANHGERTNTMGIPVKKVRPKFNIFSGKLEYLDNGVEWRKGGGTLGSSDVKGHINNPKHQFPIPVYIEIKIGKDTQSDDQKKYEKRITKSGALYTLCKTPEDFFTFYDYLQSL